jgi:hypothetical protein
VYFTVPNPDGKPKNPTPSTAGHSIGKWEGDVLVVDTNRI